MNKLFTHAARQRELDEIVSMPCWQQYAIIQTQQENHHER